MFLKLLSISALFLATVPPIPSLAADAAANTAPGPDSDLIWFDQSFRIMTCDLETTDSKCIGNPISPLCVIDTSLAATIFDGTDGNDDRLVRVALGKIPGPISNLKTKPRCAVAKGYRIYAVKHYIRSIDVPYPELNKYGIKKGDVVVNIQVVTGCKKRKCPPAGSHRPLE